MIAGNSIFEGVFALLHCEGLKVASKCNAEN